MLKHNDIHLKKKCNNKTSASGLRSADRGALNDVPGRPGTPG